jgi:hypothetical protein
MNPLGRNECFEVPGATWSLLSHGPYQGRLHVTKRGSEVIHISCLKGSSTGSSSFVLCVGRLRDEPSVEFCVDTDGKTSSSRPLFSRRGLNSIRNSGRRGAASSSSSDIFKKNYDLLCIIVVIGTTASRKYTTHTSSRAVSTPFEPPLPLRLPLRSQRWTAGPLDWPRCFGSWPPRRRGAAVSALPIQSVVSWWASATPATGCLERPEGWIEAFLCIFCSFRCAGLLDLSDGLNFCLWAFSQFFEEGWKDTFWRFWGTMNIWRTSKTVLDLRRLLQKMLRINISHLYHYFPFLRY